MTKGKIEKEEKKEANKQGYKEERKEGICTCRPLITGLHGLTQASAPAEQDK